MSSFFDIFFPPRCCVCECAGTHLCERCRDELDDHTIHDAFGLSVRCPHGGGSFSLLTTCEPNPILQRIVHAFKYTYNEELLGALGDLLVRRLMEFRLPSDVWIVPVPLHASRLRERGFNQSLLLAEYIASRVKWESTEVTRLHVADILERVRITFPQAQLSRSDRLKNVSGAFSFKGDISTTPKTVILLDDVVTTGSTILECREVLYGAGVEKVYALALSHGLS